MPLESAFDIIGPAMVGPSSSHTAGAVRIGLAGHHLLGGRPTEARVGLHGSFAATGQGHATDRGLAAGLLGFRPDDERIKDSLEISAAEGMQVDFSAVDLGEQMHPNSASLELVRAGGSLALKASSVGGGSIEIVELDGFQIHCGCGLDALVLWHEDRPGFLAHVTSILACVEANIATIQTARRHRAADALTVIELDQAPLAEVSALLGIIPHVAKLRALPPLR